MSGHSHFHDHDGPTADKQVRLALTVLLAPLILARLLLRLSCGPLIKTGLAQRLLKQVK